MILDVGRSAHPRVPVEIADAVELWARQFGRHATIAWVPTSPPTPQVRISLKASDPMRQMADLFQGEEPAETVELVKWDEKRGCYAPVSLDDLGVTGVLEILERGNTWSGRGEFSSHEEALKAQAEEIQRSNERRKRHSRDDTLAWAGDEWTWSRLGIAAEPGADFGSEDEA